MRVLHVIESLGPGGAERLLHTNLSRFSQDVESLVCRLYDGSDFWEKPIRELGVSVVSLGLTSFWQPRPAMRKLRAVVRSFAPDLIHTHLYGANVYGRIVGRTAGVPVLSSIHNPDYEPEVARNIRQVTAVSLYRVLDALTARLNRVRFLAVSEYVRESAIRRLGLARERIAVIHNPVRPEEFAPPDASAVAALRAELQIPADAPVLVSVGRLDPQKGHDILLRALPAVRARHERVVALIVGAGASGWENDLERLARQAGPAGCVRFLGERQDIRAMLALSDLFVFPSRFEGLGIALIEAMAAGRACVASDLPAVREVIDHGVDGFLVPPSDRAALASAIADLLQSPEQRAAMGRSAMEKVRDRFDATRNVAALESLYADLARTGGRAAEAASASAL